MKITKMYSKFISVLLPVFTLYTTCTEQIAGGSGSTTTNGFTAMVKYADGTAVQNATVRIRSNDYCSSSGNITDEDGTGSVLDTFTGVDGSVTVSDMIAGNYTIEVLDTILMQGVVVRSRIDNGDLQNIGVLNTEPVGVVNGVLDAALLSKNVRYSVQVYGMERLAPVDSQSGRYSITDLPPAKYAFRVFSMDSSAEPQDLDSVTIKSNDTVRTGSFSEWNHSGVLTINSQAAGLGQLEALINFPLLLRLDATNFDFSTAKKNGTDLRVVDARGLPVPFETEWWDSTNSFAAIWILIDTLTGSKSQHTLYCYWGNKKASSVSSPTSVFDTAYGYKGVWHLGKSGGTEQADATVNNIGGIPAEMDGANDIFGIIGRSQEFEEDSQRIEFNFLESNTNSDAENASFAFTIWVKPSSDKNTGSQGVFSLQNGYYGLLIDMEKGWGVYRLTSNGEKDTCFSPAASNTWSLISAVRNGSSHYIYVNDSLAGTFSQESSDGIGNVLASVLRLGCLPQDTGWFSGVLDEFRVYDRQLSDPWIKASYHTQRENQNAVSFERNR